MRVARPLVLIAAFGLVPAAAARAQMDHPAAAPAVTWGPAPAFFPAGARFAVLQGDPGQSGVYTVRLELPAGYVIRPHFHPTDEHVTVISGTFLVGMGDQVDEQQALTLGAGGFITAPAQAHHFAVAREKTVVQVHGQGPFAITYVRPSDDPRTVASNR
jgi:quercetin dioxygenase-like cupin family protein